MFDFLKSVDEALFRSINIGLSNPFFDQIMPFLSGNAFFYPALALLSGWLVWKGGVRGRLCVLFIVLVVALGDPLICNTLKCSIGRLRPFLAIEEARLLVGKGASGSMPSSHAANWFAAVVVATYFFRGSIRFMLPLALLVAFSRVYNGVHYPGDVLAGAMLGSTYAFALVSGTNQLWRRLGPKWFPLWSSRLPSLLEPGAEATPEAPMVKAEPSEVDVQRQWLRLGYVLIAVLVVFRLGYIASGKIELSEDEAYQWLWSKHLALSYYSKPPMIAYAQFLGTSVWGDTELGVRFLSPIIAAALSLMLLCFFAREVNARAGFFLIAMLTCTPLLAVGATLMTVDPLLVLFWTAAMIGGWRAVQTNGTTADWAWTGLWMGLGFLSKYTAAFQLVCFLIFFALWAPARVHLRRPGPYVALLLCALCTVPVLMWNAQHGWITVEHVGQNAGRTDAWRPTLRYFWDFLGAQAGLLNPIFFVAIIWAVFAFWKRERRNPLLLYCFSMGAPLFFGYMMFTAYKRVFPNWIAAAVVPLFCLAVIYWENRRREGERGIKPALIAGLAIGLVAVVVLHDTNLIAKATGRALPATMDPLRRVRASRQMAETVSAVHKDLGAEGKPVFVIGSHYGITSQLAFYWPEAKRRAQSDPLVYCIASEHPQNQFFFWPNYRYDGRKGENALFIQELSLKNPQPGAPPEQLKHQFRSVKDLGVFEVTYRDRVFRRLQLFACRDLK